MFILEDKCEIIHYLKGCGSGPFTKLFLKEIKKEYKNWCAFSKHGDKVDANCYLLHQIETGWIDYLKQFSISVDHLINKPEKLKSLNELIQRLAEPKLNSTSEDFEENLNNLIEISENIEKEAYKKLDALTCLECRRLGEAIACIQADCYTASIVMAASAVEARLHHLISKKNKKIYKQYFENNTLGSMIGLFDKNKYKDSKFNSLKKIIPDQHKPLLDMVNTYRIFSAHPIITKSDYKVSRTILDLSFLFLLDPELEIDQKLLIHK